MCDKEKNVIDRMVALGLGIAAYGEERVADFLREASIRGEDKRREMGETREEMKKKVASFQKAFGERVRKEVDLALKKMHLATREELEKLQQRLSDLEQKAGKKAGK